MSGLKTKEINELIKNGNDVVVYVVMDSHGCDFNTPYGWVSDICLSYLPPLNDEVEVYQQVHDVLDKIEAVPYANLTGAEKVAELCNITLGTVKKDILDNKEPNVKRTLLTEDDTTLLYIQVKVEKREDSEKTKRIFPDLFNN